MRIVRIDPISKEVINELLSQCTHFHIGIHIQVLYTEAVGTKHLPDSYHIRMHLTPRKRLNRHIQIISSGTCHFQHRRRRETWTAMTVILNLDMWIFLLYL